MLTSVLSAIVIVGALNAPDLTAVGTPAVQPSCSRLDPAVRSRFAPGSRVVILLAAGDAVPDGMRDAYREMALTVLDCVGENSRAEIFPITESGIQTAAAFSGAIATPPPRNTNELWIVGQRKRLAKEGSEAIDRMLDSQRHGETDILGTLFAAGESLHRPPEAPKSIVVVISKGFPKGSYTFAKNPEKSATDVVRRLRTENRLPNLAGTDVFIVGVTKPASSREMKFDTANIRGLCVFWAILIKEAGGTKVLGECPPTLPGLTPPL